MFQSIRVYEFISGEAHVLFVGAVVAFVIDLCSYVLTLLKSDIRAFISLGSSWGPPA
jgi:hypothetical protein